MSLAHKKTFRIEQIRHISFQFSFIYEQHVPAYSKLCLLLLQTLILCVLSFFFHQSETQYDLCQINTKERILSSCFLYCKVINKTIAAFWSGQSMR
jgi:uncharacterized membrane protein